MGNAPTTQTSAPSLEDKIRDQPWYKWCEIFTVLWAVLAPIYGAVYALLRHFFKVAPVWDAGAGAPRWFDLLLTYFCFPVAALGLYGFCAVFVGAFLRSTDRPGLRWYHVAIGAPFATTYLVYASSRDLPGLFLLWPFLLGLGILCTAAAGMISRALGRR